MRLTRGYFSYTSLLSPVSQVSGEADVSSHTPPPSKQDHLSGADVEVASAHQMKAAETHRFIWCFCLLCLFYSLASLWSADCYQLFGSPDECRVGGSIVSHADRFQTKQPAPSPRRSIWHSRLGWGQLRESSWRQMFAPRLWINVGRASAGVLRFIPCSMNNVWPREAINTVILACAHHEHDCIIINPGVVCIAFVWSHGVLRDGIQQMKRCHYIRFNFIT